MHALAHWWNALSSATFDGMPRWCQVLVESSVAGAVLAVIVIVILAFAGRWIAPTWRFILLGLIVARFCLPVVPESSLSLLAGFSVNDAVITEDQPSTPPETNSSPLPATNSKDRPTEIDSREPDLVGKSAVDTPVSWGPDTNNSANVASRAALPSDVTMAAERAWAWPILLAVWGFPAAWLLLRRLQTCLRLRRLAARWTSCDSPEAQAMLDACRREVKVRRREDLLLCQRETCPATLGVLAPRIVLGEKLLQSLTQAELRLVLLHELHHIRRLDLVTDWIASLVVCMYWFHPAAWWARRRMREERELACDAAVLRDASSSDPAALARGYGGLLLHLAHRAQPLPMRVPAIVWPARRSRRQATRFLERRITMLAQPQRVSRRAAVLSGLLVLSLAATGLTARPAVVTSEGRESERSLTPGVNPNGASGAPSFAGTHSVSGDKSANGATAPENQAGTNASANSRDANPPQQDQSSAGPEVRAGFHKFDAFLVMPVTTPLQRKLLEADEDATMFVLVDDEAVIDIEAQTLHADKLPLDVLGKIIEKELPPGGQVVLFHERQNGMASRDGGGLMLMFALKGIARLYGGNDRAVVRGGGSPSSFADAAAFLQQPDGPNDTEEPVTNELAAAYPVQTHLSRQRLFNQGVDCVIDLTPDIDFDIREPVPDDILTALKDVASRIELPQRKLVVLKYATSRTEEREFGSGPIARNEQKLAKELGFEALTRRILHMPKDRFKPRENQ